MKIGIIIQARLASTRLPSKVLLPFSGDKTILEIIIERLQKSLFNIPICVATTVSEVDEPIVEFCQKHDVKFYRGDEFNVLNRFIRAAEQNYFDKIIRVCSDNPFLSLSLIDNLIEAFKSKYPDSDYLSYKVGNTPALKSHIGIFAELVSLEALRKAAKLTSDPFYLEHVTNFIYENDELFKVNFIKSAHFSRPDEVRFTIDTPDDFSLASKLFEKTPLTDNKDVDIEKLKKLSLFDVKVQSIMQKQIAINSK